ncbi:hypothetical protein ACPPVS_14515 [Cellulomonas sp. McL0617]|uniref:hypothetical protein n=1 Tax=Cellulomonas sp. McL0617 TaxID=3415675 RepID=UPI003CEF53AB
MSTEQSTPGDETQAIDAVEPTVEAIAPTIDDETEPTIDEPGPEVDEAEDTEPVGEIDETNPVHQADQPVATTDVDPTAILAVPESAAAEPRDTHPFDLFTAAPLLAPSPPEPTLYGSPTPVAPAPAVLVDTPVAAPAPARRRLRVGTVVWGLILAAFGIGVLAWASGARIDVQLALIVLLAVAGTALLVGSILSGARHARR